MKVSKYVFLFVVIVSCFSCGPSEDELQKEKQEQERVRKEREQLQELEKKRAIKYTTFHNELEKQLNSGTGEKALEALDSALAYAKTEKVENSLLEVKSALLYKSKKYQEAIALNAHLIKKKPEIFYYERAKCYNKLNQKQEAADDLREAISLGHPQAEELFNQINPTRREVAYYVTRCCDGTTSNAKGRGACSHHGGVCNWNDPVYEEYRKY